MCSLQKWVTGGYRVYLGCEMKKNIGPEVCSEPLNLVNFFPFGGSEGVFEMATHSVWFFRGKKDTSAWGVGQ